MAHEYPPLLTAKHIAEICSCHITTAYNIMIQPNRPIWRNGKMVRMHRDLFFEQLAIESSQQSEGA